MSIVRSHESKYFHVRKDIFVHIFSGSIAIIMLGLWLGCYIYIADSRLNDHPILVGVGLFYFAFSLIASFTLYKAISEI